MKVSIILIQVYKTACLILIDRADFAHFKKGGDVHWHNCFRKTIMPKDVNDISLL